jgi:hypothetical protein
MPFVLRVLWRYTEVPQELTVVFCQVQIFEVIH